ncbi:MULTISPECIES: serine hydrolase [Flavobacteriaceae]|uniref:serine hydrolase domain-containing protein n=1 Tax=Flavobacteriaceae TaxID=49546 RepID=UPI001492B349|nr:MULTISPECIES: serine hydrolase domain-containing protein [Allomuricauda]MDC6366700.1 serine hydrolase [Muricauda sp. AC10]
MENDLLKIIKRHKVPGIAYCIVTPETTLSGGIGKVSNSITDKVGGNTRFRVGSLTKSFIAIGLLQLQEKGLLSLGDYLKDIIPEIKIDNEWMDSPISIRHLLEHTSGLGDISFNEIYSNDKNLTAHDVVNRTHTAKKVEVEPGNYFKYSNSGYLLAGYILEKYSKVPFETYLEENVLRPLDMKSSTFYSSYLDGPQPKHHFYVNGTIRNSPNKEIMNRWAGSMSTTSEDMAKFIQFLSHREESLGVLSKKSFNEFETPTTSIAAKNGIKTGYALGVMKNTAFNQIVMGNRGGTHDLHARYLYSPETKRGFFFSMNISNGACARELNQYLSEFVFPVNASNTGLENHPLTAERLGEIEGFYQSKSSRIKILEGVDKLLTGIKVFMTNDSLFIEENGRFKSIFSADGEKFHTSGSSTSHILMGQKNGSKYLIDTNDGGNFYYKTSYFIYRLRQFLVFGAMVISFISGMFFLLKIIIGSIKRDVKHLKKYWPYALMPMLLAVLFLVPTSVGLHEIEKLGMLNAVTVTLFLISMLYPLLSILTVFKVLVQYKNKSWPKHKLMICLNCAGALIITGFIVTYGYFGLKLW